MVPCQLTRWNKQKQKKKAEYFLSTNTALSPDDKVPFPWALIGAACPLSGTGLSFPLSLLFVYISPISRIDIHGGADCVIWGKNLLALHANTLTHTIAHMSDGQNHNNNNGKSHQRNDNDDDDNDHDDNDDNENHQNNDQSNGNRGIKTGTRIVDLTYITWVNAKRKTNKDSKKSGAGREQSAPRQGGKKICKEKG